MLYAALPPGTQMHRLQRRRWLQQVAGFGVSCPWWDSAWAQTSAASRGVELHVLLIGNARYQHNAALRNPPRDVQLLGQAFAARGAKVNTLLDQTAQQMDTAITGFVQQAATKQAALWIGFSGHAVQIEGINYLQGVDSDFTTVQRVRAHGWDMNKLLRLFERHAPSAAVVAVDACRNNPFEPERTRGMSQGLAPLNPMGHCISFSTAPFMRALDGDEGQHSPYAKALAASLSGSASKTLDQVLRETADSVFAQTKRKQIPEYRSALRAEWVFEGKTVALRAASTAATGGAVTSTVAREVSYRPDEPTALPRYGQATAAQWTQLEMHLTQRQRSLSPLQAKTLIQPTKAAPAEDRLLAAMVLQDGHPAVPAQPKAGRQLLEPLAQQGHVIAQNLLGESYFLERNYEHAYKWLSLAARSGYSRARTNLGQMHAMGHAGADPVAGALQVLQGMLQQAKEQTPMPGATPSPAMQEQVRQIKDLFQRGMGR